MSENRVEVLTGAIVVAVAAGFLIWAGKGQVFGGNSGTYPLHASFRSVEGVSSGTDVRMAGVKIGSVGAIALDPKTFFADMTVNIQDGIELPDDSQIIVASEGLLGGSFIEIQPGGSPDNLKAGDEITDTQSSLSILGLLMKFVGSAASGSGKSDASGAPSSASPSADPSAAAGEGGTNP